MYGEIQIKWNYIAALDEELLLGGAMISSRASALVQNADIAFVAGAPIATIILAVAAMESHLSNESGQSNPKRFQELIDLSDFEPEIKEELHTLRKTRN